LIVIAAASDVEFIDYFADGLFWLLVVGIILSGAFKIWREFKNDRASNTKWKTTIRDEVIVLDELVTEFESSERSAREEPTAPVQEPDSTADIDIEIARLKEAVEEAQRVAANQRTETKELLDRVVEKRADVARVIENPPKKSAWTTWGAGLAAGLIPGVLLLAGTVFTAINDDDVPDCNAYVAILLEINEKAPSSVAAVTAAEALEWGGVDEHCGSPGAFLAPLGSE
jgi:hypothetical protein